MREDTTLSPTKFLRNITRMFKFIIENVNRKADSGRVAGLLALISAYTEQVPFVVLIDKLHRDRGRMLMLCWEDMKIC